MTTWAYVNWPDRFSGSIRDLAERSGLVARRNSDHWRITTVDGYTGRPPTEFFSLGDRPSLDVASNVQARERARATLETWGSPPKVEQGIDERALREIRRLLHADDDSHPNIGEVSEAVRLKFLLLPKDQFIPWVLNELPQGFPPLLGSISILLVSVSQQVHERMSFVRALFTAAHAPEWFDEPDFRGFGSMKGLSGDTLYGNSIFLHPVLLAHSPWIPGFAATRPPHGIAAYLFDEVLPGRDTLKHSDILQQLSSTYLMERSGVRAPTRPSFSRSDTEDAIDWWIGGFNELLSVSLDPTVFVDTEGWYQPSRHLAHLISIDRLLATVISSLRHWGDDEYARSLLLFETLDLITGLRLGGYDTLLDPRRATSELEKIETVIPEGAGAIILPRCRAAVDALHIVKDHFHQSRIVENDLMAVAKNGADQRISLDKATAFFLTAVRNAKHTLDKAVSEPNRMSILSAHDGYIPADVSDLAFFHLVRLLTHPNALSTAWRPRRR